MFNDQGVGVPGQRGRCARTCFGRGHTNGDTVIYFPDLRVIHTGDLITEGMPVLDYNNGASAVELVKVLDEILKLDFNTVIPGHGPLLNKERIRSDREKLVTMNRAHGRTGAKERPAGSGLRPTEAGRPWLGSHRQHRGVQGRAQG